MECGFLSYPRICDMQMQRIYNIKLFFLDKQNQKKNFLLKIKAENEQRTQK